MDARLQIRVQRYGWDAAAPYYHGAWAQQLGPAHDRLLELAELRQGETVLETACGSGLVTLRAARQVGQRGKVLATDLSEVMLETLAKNLSAHEITNVQTERMAAEQLDVPDQTFDAAICALGLMYTPDPEAAVAEMVRAVKPGGRVVATVWGERRNCGWAEVFSIVDRRVASDVCPLFFSTGSPSVLSTIFGTCGLSDVRESRQSVILRFMSAKEVADAVLLGGPVALAVKRFDAATRDDVRSEFLKSLSSWLLPDGTFAIPGEFVTCGGQRP